MDNSKKVEIGIYRTVKLALRTCISYVSYLMETGFMGYAGMQMGKWEERYTATLLHATHDNNIIRFSFLI